jgi:hypothetical protein
MAWFRDKSNGADEVPGVPGAWAGDLDRFLAPLQDRGLAKALRDYVLTGADASVLARVPANRHFTDRHDAEVTPQLVADLRTVPVPTAVRFAKVVGALHDHGSWGMHPALAPVDWLHGLLLDLSGGDPYAGARPRSGPVPLDASLVEDMLAAVGQPRHLLLLAAFSTSGVTYDYWHDNTRRIVRRLQGYDEAVRRHTEQLRPALKASKVNDRLVALDMLTTLRREFVRGFAVELAECLTGGSAKVATAAKVLLDRAWPEAREPLQAIAEQGSPTARAKALELLWEADDPQLRDWCQEVAGADRAASVRELVDRWRGTGMAFGEPEQAPPERPTIDWRTDVDPRMRASLRRVVRHANEVFTHRPAMSGRWTPIDESFFDGVLDDLQAGRIPTMPPSSAAPHRGHVAHGASTADLVAVGFPGVVAVMAAAGMLCDYADRAFDHHARSVLHQCYEKTGGGRPLELAVALDDLGLDGGSLVYNSWGQEWSPYGETFPDEVWAPFVECYLDRVLDELQRGERDYWLMSLHGFRALATLPTLPDRVVDVLFDLAVGPRKTLRRPAQDLLTGVPGIADRAVGSLTDRKAESRAEAAAWLGRLRHAPALGPLEAAVAKEKNDLAMGAMLDALEALGQPVEKYLRRDDMRAQADKALAKGLPAALSWFPWTGLPDVRWADTGALVDRPVVQWMLANATKAKTAEPNAVLRKYCAMFDPRDREELGQYVLEAWLAEDIRPIDTAEAHSRAAQEAAGHFRYLQQYPNSQYAQGNPFLGASVDQITAAVLPRHLRTPAGSAAASKGVLAVAAACASGRAAPVAERYLKEWYGQRASQGRALIQMLAWVDHPSAVQLVLSVGSRFRTKSFQEEATRQAEALAERKGWTMGELADRTIPTAGFDESGVLELSYGDRVFTARLLPDLTLSLTSPEGRAIKSLPTPRQTDDPDRVKESKKALTATKKELKTVVESQTSRLYEALCTERTWSAEVWTTFLNEHPVVRHLTRRLAWTATGPEDRSVVFRPLDDGTLTDVDDAPVELHPEAVIAVAHDSAVPEQVAAAWLDHFADYEVTPLFQQFGRARYELADSMREQREVTDFQGHLLEAFKLRGRANKLGYTRGQAQDGGVFVTYEKRFPTLGITTVIGFSGNSLPEENRTVALHSLGFERTTDGRSAGPLKLQDVPAVLLSEAYGDLTSIAAVGTGFDPAWEKKVEW